MGHATFFSERISYLCDEHKRGIKLDHIVTYPHCTFLLAIQPVLDQCAGGHCQRVGQPYTPAVHATISTRAANSRNKIILFYPSYRHRIQYILGQLLVYITHLITYFTCGESNSLRFYTFSIRQLM